MPPSKKPEDLKDPENHIPLTTLAFHILLALAAQPRHGYGIILDIEERTGGAMRLRSGTLYTALQRLLNDGLLGESERQRASDLEDQRRRYYAITPLGLRVARLEATRLATMLHTAQQQDLIDLGEWT